MACNSRKALSDFFELSIPKPLNVTKTVIQNEGCYAFEDLVWDEKTEVFDFSENFAGLGLGASAHISFPQNQADSILSKALIGNAWVNLPLYLLFKQWKSWLI